jgi:AcrR family transcriptional regulator
MGKSRMSDIEMLDIAATMISKKGIASCSFRNLAEAAGTSASPFTYRFRSRQGLLLAVVERCYDRVWERVESWEPDSPLLIHYQSCLISLQLNAYIDPYLRSHDQILTAASYDPALAQALLKGQAGEIARYSGLLDRARQAGELNVETENDQLLRTIAAVIIGLNLNRYTADPQRWDPEQTKQSFAVSYRGLFGVVPEVVLT